MLQALGVSLLLMAVALAVAAVTAALICARTLWLGARQRLGERRAGGGGSAVLAALPEFLTASVLATVVGVQLGRLPALGWYGPRWTVLPGLALGLASLAFLGLGAQPPAPEWGLLLAENQPYAERAPWAVLAPAAVLALLGALAVTAAGGVRRPRRNRAPSDVPQQPSRTRELTEAG
jgi:ABC-type dipeptide/oligopeptide/nickel transport system permease component